MSISNLFYPNDSNLFCNDLTVANTLTAFNVDVANVIVENVITTNFSATNATVDNLILPTLTNDNTQTQLLVLNSTTNTVETRLSGTIPGAGNVDGPVSSTDTAIARFNGTTGMLIENSTVTLSNGGVIAGATVDSAANTVNVSGTNINTLVSNTNPLLTTSNPTFHNLTVSEINGQTIPSTIGNVVGPGSSTNTAIALFNGTTGKIIENSTATIDGSGNVSAASYTGGDSFLGGINGGGQLQLNNDVIAAINSNGYIFSDTIAGDFVIAAGGSGSTAVRLGTNVPGNVSSLLVLQPSAVTAKVGITAPTLNIPNYVTIAEGPAGAGEILFNNNCVVAPVTSGGYFTDTIGGDFVIGQPLGGVSAIRMGANYLGGTTASQLIIQDTAVTANVGITAPSLTIPATSASGNPVINSDTVNLVLNHPDIVRAIDLQIGGANKLQVANSAINIVGNNLPLNCGTANNIIVTSSGGGSYFTDAQTGDMCIRQIAATGMRIGYGTGVSNLVLANGANTFNYNVNTPSMIVGSNTTTTGIQLLNNISGYSAATLNAYSTLGAGGQLFSGIWAGNVSIALSISRIGNIVSFQLLSDLLANATTASYISYNSVIPSFLCPYNNQFIQITTVDNNVQQTGLCQITTGGAISIYATSAGGNYTGISTLGTSGCRAFNAHYNVS